MVLGPLAQRQGSPAYWRRAGWTGSTDDVKASAETMSERRYGQTGPGLVEYALIVALVAAVVIGTLILLGPQLTSIFQDLTNALSL